MIWQSWFLSFFDVRASKWAQNDPQAKKQLQILKAQVMSFPMIYDMSRYEKVDFLMYELQNGFRMALRVRMYWILYLDRCWYAGGQFVTNLNWITETSVWPTFSLSTLHVICQCLKFLQLTLLTWSNMYKHDHKWPYMTIHDYTWPYIHDHIYYTFGKSWKC